MSFLLRLFSESPRATGEPVVSERTDGIDAPPDRAARAREEEASLSQAIVDGDMATVGKWVLEASSTRTRQAAARCIVDPDQLRELIRATRHGRDKKVHRILTTRRDEQLADARSAAQLQADMEGTAAAIERHCEHPCDASYPATLAQLEARWRALESHGTAELRRRVAEHLQHAREFIERHRQALEAEEQQRRSAALAVEEERRRRELEAQDAAAAAVEQARVLAAERQAEREKRAAEEAKVRDLLGLLRQTQAALDHGGTARAARLRTTIAEALQGAPALPARFSRQLERIDARLAELQDWKNFRVVPKRVELVQRMRSLVGAELAPEELARRIRQLRDEWRTLSRGAGEEPTPEWQQFQEAAERAYEPCREHFARQAKLRRENQARREALIERLSAFAAGQAGEYPDWRAIDRAIVESRREWRQYAPVDQAVVKSLQARFHALVNDLQARLDAECARNVQAKRELITRSAELVDLADTRKAIEESKNLQRTWKSVGFVPRNQDARLWDEFRRYCDAVFQKSSQESAAHAASLEANQAQAIGCCEELERIAGLTGEPLVSALPQVEELRTRFESLDLPRAVARDLHQRFSRAAGRCAEAGRRQRAVAIRLGWTEVLAAATQVRAYALATVLGRPAADCEALQVSARSAVADLTNPPKGARGILEQQIAAVTAGAVSVDLAANELVLRLLCIRAELSAGAATPPEDLDLRREYQLRRLVESMGRGEPVAAVTFDDLALEWIAAGPVEPAVDDSLLSRFERCRDVDSWREGQEKCPLPS